ncbi:MAG: hypothetical protein KA184_08150 [Candidatus Hydrogenedentes bacterium]|nr:hypothetical protein [Candidatus Hydrogenedentota bacterium]
MREEVAAAVLAAAHERDGSAELPCAEAFAIAERLAVPVAEVGRACDEQHVKITRCQLGCF